MKENKKENRMSKEPLTGKRIRDELTRDELNAIDFAAKKFVELLAVERIEKRAAVNALKNLSHWVNKNAPDKPQELIEAESVLAKSG